MQAHEQLFSTNLNKSKNAWDFFSALKITKNIETAKYPMLFLQKRLHFAQIYITSSLLPDIYHSFISRNGSSCRGSPAPPEPSSMRR